MHKNVIRTDGGFNPIIKKVFQTVFSPFCLEKINQDEFLMRCYLDHKQQVKQYFSDREQDLLTINISHQESYQRLLTFLAVAPTEGQFKRMNVGGKITAWKDLKHPLKVESTKNGQAELLPYLHN